MGCGSTNKLNIKYKTTLVNIQVGRHRPVVQDFHCAVCGLTTPRRKVGFYHVCKGPRRIEYQVQRQIVCDTCEHNTNNVCVKQKEKYPERPCNIQIGVTVPYAQCPINKWEKVYIFCEVCKSGNFRQQGQEVCRYCESDLRG